MISLLRVVFGVLVGIGFLVGLAFLGRQFPTAAGRIWFMFLGLGSGGLLVWLAASEKCSNMF
jgi:threonine/homoserine/homoserine lactone efflux protein